MNTWTISRRISAGFGTLMLLVAALGSFALWQLKEVIEDTLVLADMSLPSILVLNECAALSRDNIFTAQQYLISESAEVRAACERRIAENRAHVDRLFKQYEEDKLIADDTDRRLFEESKRTRAAFVVVRDRFIDLAKHGKTEEAKQLLFEDVVPAYELSVKALQDNVDYNDKLGRNAGETGKTTARNGTRLIQIALAVALLAAGVLAWQISRSTNRLLRDLAVNLDQGATQTASAARQVSAASQALSSGASEQAASVEETSASLEEMSSMIRSTADNAEKAKTLAGEARAVAEAGSRTMTEMTEAMSAIDTSSAEVAKIVKNIDEIAFQTNILALNAAVEAARAGEAGAGFAVVADEVRSLAQRSAAAAKETADKIEAAIASSRRGSASCTRVGESLSQIASKVSCTDALVAEIATAAREQAQGIEQINTAMTQMDQVTQSNSASAEESASAAEELDAQAASLKDVVGQLRQLVGCDADSTLPSPASPSPSRTLVSSGPGNLRPRARTPARRPLTTGQRRAIPMPGDTAPTEGNDDDHFKNF